MEISLNKSNQQVIDRTLENQRKELEREWEDVIREKQRALHHRPRGLFELFRKDVLS